MKLHLHYVSDRKKNRDVDIETLEDLFRLVVSEGSSIIVEEHGVNDNWPKRSSDFSLTVYDDYME